jgi:hypothetical protein
MVYSDRHEGHRGSQFLSLVSFHLADLLSFYLN